MFHVSVTPAAAAAGGDEVQSFTIGALPVVTIAGRARLFRDRRAEARSSRTVCVLAVPLAITEFVSFVGSYVSLIDHLRVLRADGGAPGGRYMCLLRFTTQDAADGFVRDFDGRPFTSFDDAYRARVLYVGSVELQSSSPPPSSTGAAAAATAIAPPSPRSTPDAATFLSALLPSDPLVSGAASDGTAAPAAAAAAGAVVDAAAPAAGATGDVFAAATTGTTATSAVDGTSGSSLVELPTCPVCLERLDASVSGIVSTVCNHDFHCHCLAAVLADACPVCRYCLSGEVGDDAADPPACEECGAAGSNLWMCLLCAHVGCGRYAGEHAVFHWRSTGHAYAIELSSQRVWDYTGDGYVHRLIQDRANGRIYEMPDASDATTVLPPALVASLASAARATAAGAPAHASAAATAASGTTTAASGSIADVSASVSSAEMVVPLSGAGRVATLPSAAQAYNALLEDALTAEATAIGVVADPAATAAGSAATASAAAALGAAPRGAATEGSACDACTSDPKGDALALEYTLLLTSQLEAQRLYFEDLLAHLLSLIPEGDVEARRAAERIVWGHRTGLLAVSSPPPSPALSAGTSDSYMQPPPDPTVAVATIDALLRTLQSKVNEVSASASASSLSAGPDDEAGSEEADEARVLRQWSDECSAALAGVRTAIAALAQDAATACAQAAADQEALAEAAAAYEALATEAEAAQREASAARSQLAAASRQVASLAEEASFLRGVHESLTRSCSEWEAKLTAERAQHVAAAVASRRRCVELEDQVRDLMANIEVMHRVAAADAATREELSKGVLVTTAGGGGAATRAGAAASTAAAAAARRKRKAAEATALAAAKAELASGAVAGDGATTSPDGSKAASGSPPVSAAGDAEDDDDAGMLALVAGASGGGRKGGGKGRKAGAAGKAASAAVTEPAGGGGSGGRHGSTR